MKEALKKSLLDGWEVFLFVPVFGFKVITFQERVGPFCYLVMLACFPLAPIMAPILFLAEYFCSLDEAWMQHKKGK